MEGRIYGKENVFKRERKNGVMDGESGDDETGEPTWSKNDKSGGYR